MWEIITGEQPQRGSLRSPRIPEECPQVGAVCINALAFWWWKQAPPHGGCVGGRMHRGRVPPGGSLPCEAAGHAAQQSRPDLKNGRCRWVSARSWLLLQPPASELHSSASPSCNALAMLGACCTLWAWLPSVQPRLVAETSVWQQLAKPSQPATWVQEAADLMMACLSLEPSQRPTVRFGATSSWLAVRCALLPPSAGPVVHIAPALLA